MEFHSLFKSRLCLIYQLVTLIFWWENLLGSQTGQIYILKKKKCLHVLLTVVLSILSIPPSGDAGAPRLGCCSPSSAAALWLLKKLGPSSPPGTPAGWWDHPTSLTSPCSVTRHWGRGRRIRLFSCKLLMEEIKPLNQTLRERTYGWPMSRMWTKQIHPSFAPNCWTTEQLSKILPVTMSVWAMHI